MLSLGVMGEYVGRIYDESRDRPKYIIESRSGWEAQAEGLVSASRGTDGVRVRGQDA
jgi:hypothetical protein